jgi:hypothetical protein
MESDVLVHRLMSIYGLRERIAAALDTGVSWAEAGDDEVRSARDTHFETQGRGLMRWESEHFGDDKPILGMDFSVGGTFGFIPVMTLVSVTDPTTGTVIGGKDTPTPFATYFQGMLWDVTGRAHLGSKGRIEPAFLLRYGHTMLFSDTDSFERSGAANDRQTVIMQRLRNGTGRVARVWEAGLEARMYDGESMDLIPSEKSYLNPALQVSFGYKNDKRFQEWLECALFFALLLSVPARGTKSYARANRIVHFCVWGAAELIGS